MELLPCAHCGGKGVLYQQRTGDETDGGWFIECADHACWMTTPLKFSVGQDCTPELVAVWNRRPDDRDRLIESLC